MKAYHFFRSSSIHPTARDRRTWYAANISRSCSINEEKVLCECDRAPTAQARDAERKLAANPTAINPSPLKICIMILLCRVITAELYSYNREYFIRGRFLIESCVVYQFNCQGVGFFFYRLTINNTVENFLLFFFCILILNDFGFLK